jgi:hypothetical protein
MGCNWIYQEIIGDLENLRKKPYVCSQKGGCPLSAVSPKKSHLGVLTHLLRAAVNSGRCLAYQGHLNQLDLKFWNLDFIIFPKNPRKWPLKFEVHWPKKMRQLRMLSTMSKKLRELTLRQSTDPPWMIFGAINHRGFPSQPRPWPDGLAPQAMTKTLGPGSHRWGSQGTCAPARAKWKLAVKPTMLWGDNRNITNRMAI